LVIYIAGAHSLNPSSCGPAEHEKNCKHENAETGREKGEKWRAAALIRDLSRAARRCVYLSSWRSCMIVLQYIVFGHTGAAAAALRSHLALPYSLSLIKERTFWSKLRARAGRSIFERARLRPKAAFFYPRQRYIRSVAASSPGPLRTVIWTNVCHGGVTRPAPRAPPRTPRAGARKVLG
jgi:hypothetical protein